MSRLEVAVFGRDRPDRTPSTTGNSWFWLAKNSCASGVVMYSRKATALSRFGACTATPAAATFMCVPVVSWFGMTQAIWSTGFAQALDRLGLGAREVVGVRHRDVAGARNEALELVGVAALRRAGEVRLHALGPALGAVLAVVLDDRAHQRQVVDVGRRADADLALVFRDPTSAS